MVSYYIVAENFFVVCTDRPFVMITNYEVSNWQKFWLSWAYNSTPGDDSNYDGWFRNRYDVDDITVLYI